ncbi:Uroporphyrinogen decarboxylase-domain-containing protein [Paraphysoderma sedebokerense]|nr:Uroporphyrinogen decarboxylase-domain-containing protein [Paraphysoderma sedebokerense]
MPATLKSEIASVVSSIQELEPSTSFAVSSSAPAPGTSTYIIKNGQVFDHCVIETQSSNDSSSSVQENITSVRFIAFPKNPNSPAARCYLAVDSTNLYRAEIELIPTYLDEDDAYDFHFNLKKSCDLFSVDYKKCKIAADEKFRDAVTKECRGVGGIAFESAIDQVFLVLLLRSFNDVYIDIVKRHQNEVFNEEDKQWMLYRRGRVVNFLSSSSAKQFPSSFITSNDAYPSKCEVPAKAKSLLRHLHSPRPSFIEPLFIQAIRGLSIPRPPVWLHRQAGRYLPEYMKLKGNLNFLDMTADPSIAAEITLQPVRRYNVDAAIIFSDIMVIPQALGMDLIMQPGPFFPHPIRTQEDVDKLAYQPAILNHVYDALKLVKKELDQDKVLIGFCGAPWTLMYYMVGKDLGLSYLRSNPKLSHDLLQKCTDVAIDYLIHQVKAGADVLQVFESAGGELSSEEFNEFALPCLRQIAAGVKKAYPHTPLTVFPRGSNYALKVLATTTEYDTISIDQEISPAEAREHVGPYICLQGNLSPDVLYESEASIRSKTRSMIREFFNGSTSSSSSSDANNLSMTKTKSRYIVNLGHGTRPDMSPDAVGYFIDEAQTIYIGSRNSPLAMAQAIEVQKALSSRYPNHRFKIIGVSTKGDKILDVPLAKIGDKGLFTKELEVSLLRNEVDIVQHSLKDLETTLPDGLCLSAITKREDRRDALVSLRGNAYTLESLPKGAKVGTSSLRRVAQLKMLRSDVEVVNVRGNLNTRLRKLMGINPTSDGTPQHYDALLLACAGLNRLLPSLLSESEFNDPSPTPSLQSFKFHIQPLPSAKFVPAVSQGALGIETRLSDLGINRLLKTIDDEETRICCTHEREFLKTVMGGCQVPVGVNCTVAHEMQQQNGKKSLLPGKLKPTIEASIWTTDGSKHWTVTADSGKKAAEELLKLGAGVVIQELRGDKLNL